MHECKACGLYHNYKECSMLDGIGLTIKRKKIKGDLEEILLYNDEPILKVYQQYQDCDKLIEFLRAPKINIKPKNHYKVCWSIKKQSHFLFDTDAERWAGKIYDMSTAYMLINKLNLRG